MNPAISIIPLWQTAGDCRRLIGRWRRSHAETGYLLSTDPAGTPDRMDRKEKYRLDHFIHDLRLHGNLRNKFIRHLPHRRWGVEDFRVGCYTRGGFFKPHCDNNMGREWSLVCPLNDPAEYLGGELVFPELGLVFKPKAGTAVIFAATLLHAVRPIRRGRRFALISFATR